MDLPLDDLFLLDSYRNVLARLTNDLRACIEFLIITDLSASNLASNARFSKKPMKINCDCTKSDTKYEEQLTKNTGPFL